jgi:tetratricopeptide (TPR) repeat protein
MKRQTVTLCMIACDEEATIGMTIKSVLALVDEIIVVDTGSQDNTRIIAEGYGARVLELPWTDDFAAARNFALDEANGDWILVLDADEHLQPIRPVEFQQLLLQRHVAGYRLQIVCPRNDLADQSPGEVEERSLRSVRLYRRADEVRYDYPIREQIDPTLEVWAADRSMLISDCPLTVMHEGFRPEKRARKRERNLRILRKAIAAHPAEPYFEYQLGLEEITLRDGEVLPVAGLAVGRDLLASAWRRLATLPPVVQRNRPYAADLAAKYIATLLAGADLDAARRVAAAARATLGDERTLLLQSVAAETLFLQERAVSLDRAETADLLAPVRARITALRTAQPAEDPLAATDRRDSDVYPLRYLGDLALLEGQVGEAAELYEQALVVDTSYSGAWLGLAECARFANDRKRALTLYLRAVTENEWNHRAWLRGCSLLDELEFHDNADTWRRKVAVQFPEHPAVLADDHVADAPLDPAGTTVRA